jgi:phage-related minor tail protein
MQKLEKVVTVAAAAMAAFASAQVIIGVVALGKAILDLEKGIIAVGIALKLLEKGNVFTKILSMAVTLGGVAAAYLGVTKMLEESLKGPDTTDAEKALEEQRKAAEAASKRKDKPAITPYWEKELVGLRQLTDEYKRNEEQLIAKTRSTAATIGLGEDQIKMTEALNESTKRYNDAVQNLNNKRASLAATPQSAGRDAQIGEIDKQIKSLYKLSDAFYDTTQAEIKNSNELVSKDKIRLVLLSDQISLQERLTALQADSAKIGLSSIEKKYYDIEAAAKKAAEAEIRVEEQRRFGENAGKGPNFSLGEDVKKQITDAADTRVKKEKEAALATYENQRTFSAGWKDAFASYAENAANAADQARSMFQKVTSGFEDLIVNFVKTGKLNFKDFANSVIEQFVRIQAQKLALNLFGGSGTSDFFSSILGRATGGPVNAMTPYMVGERGPELFVPRSSGSIVPNNALAGATNVTYNITATDASSFRQMLAREPEFIYAVTERGRSSVPGSRR